MNGIGGLIGSLSPAQLAISLSIASAVLFLVEDRRVALAPLLAQYVVLGLIIGGRVLQPVLYLFVGIGVAVSLVLILSAGRVQRVIARSERAGASAAQEPSSPSDVNAGPVFNAMSLALAGVSAYAIWRVSPIPLIPPELSLASYWLVASGLVLAIVAREPLRMGYGIITLVNGAVSAYLLLERSLLVFALLGVLYGVTAIATVICAERWVDAHEEANAS